MKNNAYELAGAGWVIHLSTVESVARIISLLVPTVLTVLVFLRNRKNDKK